MAFSPAARAAWTYAGGALNAAQTYDGLGVDAALNPRSQGTGGTTDNDYIGSGSGGTGSITMASGTLTIGANDFKIANGNGSNGAIHANGGVLNINQIGQWGGGIGTGGTGVLNIAVGAVVNWQTSGSSEQRFMIGNGGTGNGTLNLNGGTLNNFLDTAQALTDAERQWRVGSDAGTGTVNLNAGTWNVTGAIPFFLGGKYTVLNGTPVLNQSASVSVINITSGSLVQTGIATSTGFSTTKSTFTVGANDYVNFIAGGTGSLSLQGWEEADFHALVDAGKIRMNGAAVAGQYGNFVYSSTGGQGVYKLSGALLAPAIATQPVNAAGFVGQALSITAVASGNPSPSLQWQKSTDGGANWANVSGATGASLSFAPLAYANNGSYRLVATNSLGSATSDAVALVVTYPAPAITTAPLSQTVLAGEDVSLSVVATGLGSVTYQWQKDGSNLSGETGATLTLPDLTSGGTYTVVVSDHAAEADSLTATIASASATIQVLSAAVPQHAISLNFVGAASSGNTFGGAVDLGTLAPAESAGILPVANWNNSAAINGVATQSAPLALLDNVGVSTPVSVTWSATNTWAVLATQGAAAAKTAAGRLLHGFIERRVATAPGNASATFTQIPYGTYDVYVYLVGGTAGTVGKVALNGSDSGALYYKSPGAALGVSPAYMQGTATDLASAQAQTYNSNFVRFTGLSGASLSVAVADAVTNTNAGGLAGISIVDTTPAGSAYPPLIGSAPVALLKKAGVNASFTVSASSVNPNGVITYQWSKDGSPLSGATSATLSLTGIDGDDTGRYTVVVTDTSTAAGSPTTATLSTSLVVVDSGRPALLNADVGVAATATQATGLMLGDGILRTTGIPATNPNEGIGLNTGGPGTDLWNALTGAAGSPTYSGLVDSTGLALPGVSVAFSGFAGAEDNVTLGALGTVTDGSAPLLRDLAYTDSQTVPITCTVSGLADFAGKKITLVVYAVGKGSTFVPGQSALNDAATVTFSGDNNYLGTAPYQTSNVEGRDLLYNYQAYAAFDGIVSATGTVVWTLGADIDGGRIPLNGFQLLLTSADVNVAPSVNTQPVSATRLAGLAYTFVSGVTASPAATLQWQKSADGVSGWTNVSGATSSSLAFAAVASADAGYYRLVATNTAGSATSNVASLAVQSYPLSSSRGISVNWREIGTAATGVSLAADQVAGVVGLANWNNVIIANSATAQTYGGLIDSLGTTTTASLSIAVPVKPAGSTTTWTPGIGAWHAFGPTATAVVPMQRIYANYWDIAGGASDVGASSTLTASGIPYSSYDVYVYLATDGAGNARTAQFALNGGAAVFVKVPGSGATDALPPSMIEADAATAATSAGTATLATHVKFSGLSGASFTLAATKVDANYGIVGIQIVNTGGSSATALQSWRLEHFGTTANTGSAADTADPDGDGLANLLEYAFGENPKVANDGPSVVVGKSGDGKLTITFAHIDDPTVTYLVQSSNDLTGSWTDAQSYTGFSVAGVTTHTDTVVLGSAARRFLRVLVSVP